MWRYGGRSASALFLAALVRSAGAEEPAVHVIASRLPHAEAGVAQPVHIVPRAAIVPRASVADVLRALPGLHVDQPGAPAGFPSLYLRGADPSHTAYFLDGVRLNDPTNARGGGFDFGALDPHALERIEVLPGASSALYGADAMAGVVSLRTPRPGGEGMRLSGGLGGLGYRRLAGVLDGEALRAEAALLEDGGAAELGFKRIRSLALRAPRAALRVWQHETRGFPEDSGGPQLAVLRALERRDGTTAAASAEADGSAAGAVLRLRLSALAQEHDLDSPGVAPGLRDPAGLPRTLSSSTFSRWGALATAELENALIGAEYQREDGDSRSTLFFGPLGVPTDFSLERATRSLFAEGRAYPLPRLLLSGGLRLDDIDGFATQTSVRAGARWLLAAGPSVALNVGTGFKPPSFFALGHPLVGNPALRPEESESVELSAQSSEEATLRQRASVFRSRYRDLVDFDPGPPPLLVNRSRVTIEGLEYAIAASVMPGVSAEAGLAAFSYELPPGSGPLRSRPRNKASASVSAALGESASLSIFATRVGRVFDSSIPTGGRTLDPYLVVDAALGWRQARSRFTIALDNVFDRDYQQFIGFPAAGRRLRFEASLAL